MSQVDYKCDLSIISDAFPFCPLDLPPLPLTHTNKHAILRFRCSPALSRSTWTYHRFFFNKVEYIFAEKRAVHHLLWSRGALKCPSGSSKGVNKSRRPRLQFFLQYDDSRTAFVTQKECILSLETTTNNPAVIGIGNNRNVFLNAVVLNRAQILCCAVGSWIVWSMILVPSEADLLQQRKTVPSAS
uniref:Uncharacterized protein n=1 Tax=Knipowitschia caucasica TaxID=637954 RepID=A0AAV2LSJ9_KNICA